MPFTFVLEDYQKIQLYLQLNPQSLQGQGGRKYILSYSRSTNIIDLRSYGKCLEDLDKDLGRSSDPERSYVNKVKGILAELDSLEIEIEKLQMEVSSTLKELEVDKQYSWARADNKSAWDGAELRRAKLISQLLTILQIKPQIYNGQTIRSY
ncbi:MAG: hypothetical protein QNJ54_01520 [Prochloraceae cyanobacterium]|nr:hypothetical protein [Prochloraceae cyanobacterium]